MRVFGVVVAFQVFVGIDFTPKTVGVDFTPKPAKTPFHGAPKRRNDANSGPSIIPTRPEFQLVRNGWLRRVIGSVSLPDTDRLELRIVWNLGSSGKGDRDFKFGRSGIYSLCEWLKSSYRAGYTSGRSGMIFGYYGRSGIRGRPGFGYCVLTSALLRCAKLVVFY